MKTKILIPILTLLILTTLSLAINEDFTATSLKDSISICPSSPDIADIFTITNTGSVPSTYQITLSGKASVWTTLSETSLFLEQGQSKDIFVYIRSNAQVSGKFNLKINIHTDFGLSKEIQRDIEIRKCQNLQIFQKVWAYDVPPCTPVTYEFEIFNTGKYVEMYDIKTTGKWAQLSHTPAIIEPNQLQTVLIYVAPPCEEFGTHNFDVEVTARNSPFTATFPQGLNIQPLYNYSLASQEEYTVCTDTDVQLPFTLTNKADLQNAYKLTLKSPAWVTLDKRYPILEANQEGTLYLNTSAASEGNYSVTLKSESLRGQQYLEKTFNIIANKCHELDLRLPGPKDTVCSASEKRYSIEIDNKGESNETFELTLNAPDWVTLSEDTIEIEPSTTKQIILIVNPTENTTGRHNIEVTAKITGTNIKKSATLQTEIISGKQCSAFIVLAPTMTINNSLQTLLIPVMNQGAQEQEFKLNIDAPDFIELNQNTLSLAPGEQGNIKLNIDPKNKGTFEVLIQASTETQAYSEVLKITIGENETLEFVKIYLLYVIIGLGIILIISGIIKLKELKSKPKQIKSKK